MDLFRAIFRNTDSEESSSSEEDNEPMETGENTEQTREVITPQSGEVMSTKDAIDTQLMETQTSIEGTCVT